MTTGDKIKQLRLERGLSQQELAAELGYTDRSSIAKIEAGKLVLGENKLKRLFKVFRITPAEYFGVDSGVISDMPSMHTIPLIGSIACGDPITAVENHEGEVNIPDNIHADFALRCKGDSMINARLFDGDIVYIRAQNTVDNGQIAAVIVDGEATLKRVHLFQDHIVLEAANPLFQPLVYWKEDQKDIHIIGKAVGFTSTHI